jgi:4,5-dihydroxyphthalate decarboxylase
MAEPRLTFATGKRYGTKIRYDTKFLMNGTVRVKGFDIQYPEGGIDDMTPVFHDMVTDLSYDIGEQAFAHYVIAKDRGKPLTAIPAFPSRIFPHFGVSVNRKSGIETPQDLVGKRVVFSDWGFNPAVWMRGILTHQYDVPIERVTWLLDEKEPLFHGLDYPHSPRFQFERIDIPEGRGQGVRGLLDAGTVDALFTAAAGIPPNEHSKKLFDDPYGEIRAYVAQTGVFPLNTVVTIREDAVEKHPDLPRALMDAWNEADRLYTQELRAGEEDTYHMNLDVRTLEDMGVFPIGYGLEANRQAVRTMVQYCYEQGLIQRLFEPEELFCV